jgi:putative membrane protein
MPSDASSLPPVQRLHPVSLLFSLGAAARRLLLPGIVVLFAARGSNAEIWIMVLFFPAAVAALVKYLSYRYQLRPDEIVVREGIVTRNERHIPYARIQNINLVQNPLHRLMRVSEVHLETAGGDKPEAVIRVLSLAAIERLRAQVFEGRRDAAAAVEGGATELPRQADASRLREVLRLPLGELVLFGLISNRGTALVAAAAGVAWQLDLGIEERLEKLPRYFLEHGESLAVPGPLITLTLGVAAVVAILLVLRLLSVIWAILKFHGFTLTRRDEDLRASYGLLTRISATVPRHRIQLLSTRTRVLHRLCGRAVVQVETAGGGAGRDAGGSVVDRLWLAPLIRATRVPKLLQEVFPEVPFDTLDWQPLDPRARRRIFRRAMVLLLLAAAAGVAALGFWGLVVLVLGLPWAWLHAKLYLKYTAYALTPSAVAYRSGWWVRRLSVVRFNKAQVLALRQSLFDRRYSMASVQVDTAGAGKVGHRIDIGFLGIGTARAIVERVSDEASRTAFRW